MSLPKLRPWFISRNSFSGPSMFSSKNSFSLNWSFDGEASVKSGPSKMSYFLRSVFTATAIFLKSLSWSCKSSAKLQLKLWMKDKTKRIRKFRNCNYGRILSVLFVHKIGIFGQFWSSSRKKFMEYLHTWKTLHLSCSYTKIYLWIVHLPSCGPRF